MAHKHGLTGRMLAMALAMIMIVTSLPQTALTAYAAEETVDASQSAPETEIGGGIEASSDEATDNDHNAPADGESTPADEADNPADDGKDPADGGDFFVEETPEEGTPEADQPAEEEAALAEDEAPVEEEAGEVSDVFDEMERPAESRVITDVKLNDLHDDSLSMDVNVSSDAFSDSSMVVTVYYREKAAEGAAEATYLKAGGVKATGGKTPPKKWTASISSGIKAETTYEYIAVLTDKATGDTVPEDAIDSYASTFTTKSFKPLKSVSVEPGVRSVFMQPAAEFEWLYTGSVNFHVRYRENKEGAAWSAWFIKEKHYTKGTVDASYEDPFQFTGDIAPETKYQYQMIADKSSSDPDPEDKTANMVQGEFETVKDARTLGEVTVTEGIRGVKFTVPYTGVNDGDTYAAVYVRKSGTTDYTKVSDSSDEVSGKIELKILGLEAETEYEYAVVLDKEPISSSTYDTSATYCGTKADKFTTKKESRTVTKAAAEVMGKYIAAVSFTYEGATEDVDFTRVVVYYREKKDGSEDKYKIFSTDYYSEASYTDDFYTYDTLEEGKTYEYIVALVDNNDEYPANYDPKDETKIVTKTDVQTFTMNSESRAIGDGLKITPAYGFATFEVPVTGASIYDYYDSTYVQVYWRKEGTTKYDRNDEELNLSYGSNNSIVEVTASPLEKGQKYEYIVILKSSSSYLTDEQLSLDPGKEADKEQVKALGILDKKAATFETPAEKRQIVTPVVETSFSSAVIKTGFTGSFAGETTRMYLFLLDKETNKYKRITSDSEYDDDSDEAEYQVQYTIEDLTAGEKYAAVFLLSESAVSQYPLAEGEKAVVDPVEISIETKAESRKLSSVAASAGYQSINISAQYEGNLYGEAVYLYTFWRKSDDPNPSYNNKIAYDGRVVEWGIEGDPDEWDNTFEKDKWNVLIDNEDYTVTPGTEYEYAVILSDKYISAPSITKEDVAKMPKDWVVEDKCTTKKAEFDVKVAYNSDKSTVGYSVLDVAFADSTKPTDPEDIINVRLSIYRADDTEKDYQISVSDVTLKSSNGYSAALIDTKGLLPNTKYIVDQIDLYAQGEKNAWIQRILPKEGSTAVYEFTTVSAEVSVELSAKEVYLNRNEGSQRIKASVSPQTGLQLIGCTVDPATSSVASITGMYNRAAGLTEIEITPLTVGDTKVKVYALSDPEQKELASFDVHVKDYVLVEVPAEGAVKPVSGTYANPYQIEKGASKELAVYSNTAEGLKKVDGTISLKSGKSIISWGDGKTLTGVNIGKQLVKLEIEEKVGEKTETYAVSAYVEVTVPSKGFIVTDLKNVAYPAIVAGEPSKEALKATVAGGKQYLIEGYLSPLNEVLSDAVGDAIDAGETAPLVFSVTKGADKGVTVSPDGTIRTPVVSAPLEAEITVKAAVLEGTDPWTSQEAKITLDIRPLPEIPASMGYVLTNVAAKLGDVKLDEKYAGWSWDDAATTPLFSTAAGTIVTRNFTVSHSGSDGKYYPVSSQKITLNVVTLKDMRATLEDSNGNDLADSNNVVELEDGKASVSFSLKTLCLHRGSNWGDMEAPARYNSLMDESQYQYKLEPADKKMQPEIKQTSAFVQTASFTKAGVYNFNASVLTKSGNKTILTKKYTVKVVDTAQVVTITPLTATYNDAETTDARGNFGVIPGSSTMIYAVDKKDLHNKGLIMTVETYDAKGKVIADAKLVWKSSDPKVAAVSADKKNSKIVTIKPGKEQGHTTITATAKDTRGETFTFVYEFQNKAPRVDKKAVKVNLAYDTDTTAGQFLAEAFGSVVEIVPVYNCNMAGVKLYKKTAAAWDAETTKVLADDFGIMPNGGNEYLITSSAAAKSGKTNLWLVVNVYDNDVNRTLEYAYPLSISASAKAPAVSVKSSGKINLFYVNRRGQESVDISVSTDYYTATGSEPSIGWKSDKESPYGFEFGNDVRDAEWKGKNVIFKHYVDYAKVRVDNKGKLVDTGVEKGKVTVTLPGIRKQYGGVVEKAIKIATVYKKPALTTMSAATNIIKDAGIYGRSFYVYNKTEKKRFYYIPGSSDYDDFSSAVTKTDGVVLSQSGSMIYYTYNGSKKSEKIVMTVENPKAWREPLTATHTIKSIAPKAVLNRSTITTNSTLDDLILGSNMEWIYNSGTGDYDYVPYENLYISLQGYGTIALADVEIQGVKDTEKKLVADNFIEVYNASDKAHIKFQQNALKALGGSLKKGTYKFKIKPYYTAADGTVRPLNEVTLSIKVVDKKMTAKTSAKGSLDIAKHSFIGYKVPYNSTKPTDTQFNVMKITTKFANLPSGVRTYGIRDGNYNYDDHVYTHDIEPVLKGQYADCFELKYYNGSWYLGFAGFDTDSFGDGKIWYNGFSSDNNNKLKAGTTIPLSIDYKINVIGSDNQLYTAAVVNGGTFNVKIKQSKPKVKVVSGNNQVLYAAAPTTTRWAQLSVPAGYSISSAGGTLDCNKDGSPDIAVTYGGGGTVTISITDPDAVFASSAGKTLSIPVTVTMVGSDGVSKDASVSIKVKVKR